MKLTIYTDGGSLNNPGRAASAFLIYGDNNLIHKEGTYIGIASNNVAEYTGLVNALQKTVELVKDGTIKNLESISCIADSQLMVNQMNGIYKIKHADMRDLYMKVKMLEAELNVPIKYTHVLREMNADADALVKKALSE
jgi:ribonuclease HI